MLVHYAEDLVVLCLVLGMDLGKAVMVMASWCGVSDDKGRVFSVLTAFLEGDRVRYFLSW